jgi:hypothetical protein
MWRAGQSQIEFAPCPGQPVGLIRRSFCTSSRRNLTATGVVPQLGSDRQGSVLGPHVLYRDGTVRHHIRVDLETTLLIQVVSNLRCL